MFAQFSVVGVVRKIKVSGGEGRNGQAQENARPGQQPRLPSAILTVQYGHRRDTSGGPVEFMNALQMRVPSHTWGRLSTQVSAGMIVEIRGKLQGVYKTMGDGGYLATEMVIESMRPLKTEAVMEMVEAARQLSQAARAVAPAAVAADDAPAGDETGG